MSKFQESLATWKDWLSEEAYSGWCVFSNRQEKMPQFTTQTTHWPLHNIHGTYKAGKEKDQGQPLRISGQDAVVPQVNVYCN